MLLHSSTAGVYSCVTFVVAAEQHEQDMLEELDRMREECATLQDDAQVNLLPSFNNSMRRPGQEQHA